MPTAVEKRVVLMSAESVCGSVTPELPRVRKARVIPKTVPSKPKIGESVSKKPRAMPAMRSLRFTFMLPIEGWDAAL